MAEKRSQNNVKEVEEAKSNEVLRRKAGKVRKKVYLIKLTSVYSIRG